MFRKTLSAMLTTAAVGLACDATDALAADRDVADVTVIKRSGTKEPYRRDKVVSGIEKALTNRPVTEEQLGTLVSRLELRLRRKGPQVTSQDVGLDLLAELKKVDQVAYMRFASVYKDFQEISDFEQEVGMLLQKRAPAKPRARR